MSIAWMSRVWSSEEPTEANERLLLLAIADAANEDGICWPSVKALARKCGVRPRTVRKNLARLIEQGFIERLERPGRSNVYRLRTPESEDTRSPASPGPAGQPHPGTRGPGSPVAPDSPPRSPATAGTIIEPSLNPQHNHQRPRPLAALLSGGDGSVVVDEGHDEGDVLMMLLRRGIAEGVAAQLVRQYDPGRIRRQVGHYDRQRATGGVQSPGWLVKAIEHDWPVPETGGGDLMTYRDMLRWCEANGGLHRTAEFEVVKQPDGQTFFRPPVTAR